MMARILLALSLLSPLLVISRSRADYDWYAQEEGSPAKANEEDPEDDEDASRHDPVRPSAAGEGFSPGLRLSYAHPLGEAAKDADLVDAARGAVNVQLDLDYGLSPALVVGVYLAVGGGLLPKDVKSSCDQFNADCKVISLSSGLSAAYRILPAGIVDPWVGANFGIEWLRTAYGTSAGDGSIAFLGIGFGLTVGADVQLGKVAFGPYVSPQFGRFMHAKVKFDVPIFDGEGNQDGKVEDRAFHYWLNFGLRARYQF